MAHIIEDGTKTEDVNSHRVLLPENKNKNPICNKCMWKETEHVTSFKIFSLGSMIVKMTKTNSRDYCVNKKFRNTWNSEENNASQRYHLEDSLKTFNVCPHFRKIGSFHILRDIDAFFTAFKNILPTYRESRAENMKSINQALENEVTVQDQINNTGLECVGCTKYSCINAQVLRSANIARKLKKQWNHIGTKMTIGLMAFGRAFKQAQM